MPQEIKLSANVDLRGHARTNLRCTHITNNLLNAMFVQGICLCNNELIIRGRKPVLLLAVLCYVVVACSDTNGGGWCVAGKESRSLCVRESIF